MTKALTRRFLATIDDACRSRTKYDTPARILRELIRETPALWAEVKESLAAEEAIKRIVAHSRVTPPASNPHQLNFFE
jgi:hypothetical protein